MTRGREGGQSKESFQDEKYLGSVLPPIGLLNIYLPCGEPLAGELVSLYGKKESLWVQSLAQVH